MGSGASKTAPSQSTISTYQIEPNYVFSVTHASYSANGKVFEFIPPPKQHFSSKTAIFKELECKAIDDKAVQAPSYLLERPYQELIRYLTGDLDNDLSKVRALYRWITAQPVDMMLAPRNKPSINKPIYHIWAIKNSEGNYSQWFSKLCRTAKIPCVIIHGRLKGSSYQVGESVSEDEHYGEWNAVLIDGVWRFVDAYWGACAAIEEQIDEPEEDENGFTVKEMVLPKNDQRQANIIQVSEAPQSNDNTLNLLKDDIVKTPRDGLISQNDRESSPNRTLTYTCAENYFLTDPSEMIYSHYPEVPEWQLLQYPWTIDKFESCANTKDRFFELGMSLESHKKCVIDCKSGDLEVLLGVPLHEGLNYKFQFILYKLDSSNRVTPQYNRNVFMHRPVETALSLNVRAPTAGVYRLELVGRDVRIRKPSYDYDWIITYKINFEKGSDNRQIFPNHPDSGWGPASHTHEIGLIPISNKTGEVRTTTTGDAQISFKMMDEEKLEDAIITSRLFDSIGQEIPNTVVYRHEDEKLIFNVKTPHKGEFSLRLYLEMDDGSYENFCNYLIISNQRHGNEIFPDDLNHRIGKRRECDRVKLKPTSYPSAVIATESTEIALTFDYQSGEQLYHSFVSNEKFDAIHCFEDRKEGETVTYTLTFPKSGVYGFKLGVKNSKTEMIDPIFDYAITYNSGLPVELVPVSSLSIYSEDGEEEVLRRAVVIAVDAHDEDALEAISRKLKKKRDGAWVQALLLLVDNELDIIRTTNRLVEALNFRHIERTRDALRYISEMNYTKRMRDEVKSAKRFLARHDHIIGLLHAVLDLDNNTVAEIKAYSHPPEIVHKVMMATLLLLGYYEDETTNWNRVQHIMGKTGSESIKRQIQAFDINALQLDVAVGAKIILGDITLENIRITSAGAAAFFVWTKGVVTETETRHREEMEQTLPRTRKKKAKKRMKKEKTNIDIARTLYS